MYKNIFKALTLCLPLLGFVHNTFAQYDASDFTAEGRKYQPAPSGHTPGKDNGPGFGFHSAGEDCGICHKPAGRAPNHVFSMAGTLYEDRTGRRPLKGGEVILQDINGKVISMTSNEAGNFWTYEPIGSNPYTVVGKDAGLRLYTTDASGFHPADPKYPQTWQYKTWVRNGDQTVYMATVAPVGGATMLTYSTTKKWQEPDMTSRMSCSMHHAPMGSRGALWVSAKSTLKTYPASGLSFKKHILPIFKNKCVPCHVPGDTRTRIVTKTDLDTPNTRVEHSGNLDLTSYNGGSSNKDTDGTTKTRKGVSDPAIRSTILPKTDGTILHGGGKFWTAGNPDYEAIKKWIVEGAQNN